MTEQNNMKSKTCLTKGFAVIASEVRGIAKHSTTDGLELKMLSTDSVVEADTGSKMVKEAGATMQRIVDDIKRVDEIMMKVTAATLEQVAGTEHGNGAAAQLDQVT